MTTKKCINCWAKSYTAPFFIYYKEQNIKLKIEINLTQVLRLCIFCNVNKLLQFVSCNEHRNKFDIVLQNFLLKPDNNSG